MSNFWDEYYKKPLDDIPWQHTQADWFRELIDNGVVQGESALDVGCGTGMKSVYLAQHGFKNVVGIDIAPQAISYAKENAEKEGVSDICTFHVYDARKLCSFPNIEMYDVVIDWAFLHCITPAERIPYTTCVSSIVKKGGYFIIRVFTSPDGKEYFEETVDGVSSRMYMSNEAEVQKLFPDFECIDQHTSAPRTKSTLFFSEFLLKRK